MQQHWTMSLMAKLEINSLFQYLRKAVPIVGRNTIQTAPVRTGLVVLLELCLFNWFKLRDPWVQLLWFHLSSLHSIPWALYPSSPDSVWPSQSTVILLLWKLCVFSHTQSLFRNESTEGLSLDWIHQTEEDTLNNNDVRLLFTQLELLYQSSSIKAYRYKYKN